VHPSIPAHMWQPSSGRLQHQRLPQGGLAVTQPTFFQPTAALDKVLQGSFQHCAVPMLRPTPLPAPAATSRKHPPHPPRRLPHSKSSHQPPHAPQTRRHRWQRSPLCHTSRHRQNVAAAGAASSHATTLHTAVTSSASAAAARKGCHAKQHLLTCADITACDAAAATAATKLTSRQCQERRQHIGSCHRHAGSHS
jgi:hypothetical protein